MEYYDSEAVTDTPALLSLSSGSYDEDGGSPTSLDVKVCVTSAAD
jgi:hypothetical protein